MLLESSSIDDYQPQNLEYSQVDTVVGFCYICETMPGCKPNLDENCWNSVTGECRQYSGDFALVKSQPYFESFHGNLFHGDFSSCEELE